MAERNLSRGQSPKIGTTRSLLEVGDLHLVPGPVPSTAGNSPSLKPKGGKLKKLKSRPHIKRLLSSHQKLIYSVDDDVHDDIDEDFQEAQKDLTLSNPEKKYLEGYHDALRRFYQQKRKKLVLEAAGGVSEGLEDESELQSEHLKRIPESVRLNLDVVDDVPNQTIEFIDDIVEELPGVEEETEHEETRSVHSSSSSETIESLNLKERQNAINLTHPFGIKIWKPSIYKKSRSVATRAEEDIHDYDPKRPAGRIFWGVYVSNVIWSVTIGLFLYLVCVFGAMVVFVLSGFAYHKQLRPYVRLLFRLGRYWFYPFGKFVLLKKDENYLDEDELDGRSISEFHKWRLQEEGRLFFAPPRRMTNSNSESRPLLKDHKGRPLRDAYSSLGDTDDGAATSEQRPSNSAVDDDDENADLPELESSDIKVRFFGRGSWSSGRFMFYLFFYGILQPILYVIATLCWIFVFTIPISNVTSVMCDHLRRRPLALHFEQEKEYYKKVKDPKFKKFFANQSIILCTYRCCGWHYYKYTIDGTNVFFINLLLVVVFVIFDYFVLKESMGLETWYTDASFLFFTCMFSIVPLAYFIGQAVASISVQSSMGVGAVINAFFSTVVEIFLYCVALNQSKGKLVEGSMIGSILGGVLLLPGLSMCGGALKRKTQRYNPRSAGVSSTMLLFAMVTMFAPSLFYQMYGSYEIRCRSCDISDGVIPGECTTCRFIQPTLSLDNLYFSILRPFSVLVACALFIAYVCGLFFTLRTHASLIWATNSHEQQALQSRKDDNVLNTPSILSLEVPAPRGRPTVLSLGEGLGSGLRMPTLITASNADLSKLKVPMSPKPNTARQNVTYAPQTKEQEPEPEQEGGAHDAPNWSRNKSTIILLGATFLYAIIAEILVNNVDAVLSNFPINPKFLGLTVFALVPNTTEFVNAISFAVSGNVALSMEIGSAYALQVVLIQIPSLVIYSIVMDFKNVDMIFSLIFPRWDIIATLISIYLFTYIYAEGKSNYFKGVILILIYVVVMIGFYLDDQVADLDDGYGGGPTGIFAKIISYGHR